jgi:uncharacterized protein YuzE
MAKTRKKEELRFAYDKEADVLYMAIGAPHAGVDDEVEDGVFIRRNARTHKVIGLTIIDFVKRFSRPLDKAIPVEIGEMLELRG